MQVNRRFHEAQHLAKDREAKLRRDQRVAKAETAVIVSQSLRKGVEHFDLICGMRDDF